MADRDIDIKERCLTEYNRWFGGKPEFFIRAPGRVNLIGEHTDYNDGFVLPMAIERSIWMAVRGTSRMNVRIYSLDYNEMQEFELSKFHKDIFGWGEYIKGVAWALQEAGYDISGFEATIAGDIPIGAGLSSSAALEIASARAFCAVSLFQLKAFDMAKHCQRAENDWVGMDCGIMDQMICALGQKGHAIFMDCRSLETRPVPLPEDIMVIIMDTTTRRKLANSSYGERREQCKAAAQLLNLSSLRDLNIEQFEDLSKRLNPLLKKRARHVITENARVLEAVQAMEKSDGDLLGRLMDDSHISLRDDFEVSGQELNLIVECARNIPGCIGARMTGAGFNGCAVALVRSGYDRSFKDSLSECFKNATGLTPVVYACRPQDGAKIVH